MPGNCFGGSVKFWMTNSS